MSSADTATRSHPDVPFRAVGVGHYSARYCMGCHKHVGSTVGSKGKCGLKWRCAGCVTAKAGKT